VGLGKLSASVAFYSSCQKQGQAENPLESDRGRPGWDWEVRSVDRITLHPCLSVFGQCWHGRHNLPSNSVLRRTAKGSSREADIPSASRRRPLVAKLRVTVEQQESVRRSCGHASRICCMMHRALGFRVRLKGRMLRRSWPITKKQYRTPKVSLGTVKKSIAAMASR
jgi:hypothetical protein